MSKKLMGRFENENCILVYDGVTRNGRSRPIAICPKCGYERRIDSSHASDKKRGAGTFCASCARSGPALRKDVEECDSGAIVHWNKRNEQGKLLVEYACGHTLYRKINSIRVIRNGTGRCKSCMIPSGSSGAGHPCWQGGKTIDKDGYVKIHLSLLPKHEQTQFTSMVRSNGYILEHRLVVARELGRPLTKTEIIHHLNGVKDDNRPENLQLVSHGEHAPANKKMFDSLKAEIARLQNALDAAGIEY